MKVYVRFWRASVAILFLTILLPGCEENLDLREDFSEPFTLYGVLSPDLGTQYIRVYPIDEFPRLDQDVPGDIRFTSVDLMTGEEIIWTDTVDIAPNGQKDLIFKASFVPEHEHVYRVEATRLSDGASSYAEVRIPPLVTIRSEDIIIPEPNAAILRVLVEGEDIRLLKPEITYDVMECSNGFVGDRRSFHYTHHRLESPTENGWEIPFNIWFDRLFVTGEYGLGIRPFILILNGVEIRFLIGDAVWDPPFGQFELNLLANREILNNVVNGFGFVGAGYRLDAIPIAPSCELLTDAEYICPEVLMDDRRLPC